MLLPRRLLPVFDAYIAVERAAAVAKFAQRRGWEAIDRPIRSEEHTSELQSLMRISYAVFCLKKKTKVNQNTTSTAQYPQRLRLVTYRPHDKTYQSSTYHQS